MESFLPLGGFQLPFVQRSLSRLYNDTKKSSDFVKEPVQHAEDPEIKALHRKLRIQKDRLVSWGLEWSDPNQSAEIDESLSKAGLSDLVGSIMSTIKDILAEAEPLWLSSKRLVGEKSHESDKSAGDRKVPLVVWDKGRFEDLVRDLTASIDTLYDLSRTRSSAAMSAEAARARLYKATSSLEDLRPFESARMQTPQQIDPNTLQNLRAVQAEPMTEQMANKTSREIVFMSKQAYSELTHRAGRQPWSPLLLEYAGFDPIYSTTGIMPSMTRFERLCSGLQTDPQRSPGSWIGLPRLLGYFEDMDNSRLGLVYQFPATFNPVSFEHLTQNPLYNLCSLSDLLSRPDFEPKLEAKFRLAYNLANTVFDMHARGITHGNLSDANVSFCNAVATDPGMGAGEVDVRRPLISSFEVFTDDMSHDALSEHSLFRHPLDPRTIQHSPLQSSTNSKTLDLYSLAMLLVSIGLWTNIENLAPSPDSPSISESVLEQLAIRCGTLYMKAVQACWNAVDQELLSRFGSDDVLAKVQIRANRYLEACCILDGVSGLEERLGDDLGDAPIPRSTLTTSTSSLSGPSRDTKQRASVSKESLPPLVRAATAPSTKGDLKSSAAPLPSLKKDIQSEFRHDKRAAPKPSNATGTTVTPMAPPMEKAVTAPKLRLYPQVPLPPEAVEQWNTVVMPQIDQALRHFYRKHPESVEISLESIGESPQKTQPTVLVVCTSVGKVRGILKKKLGSLFEGSGEFGLKVCRGQVLRSRGGRTRRSMAGLDEIVPANPDHQLRPQNGASIGAWIGDRHLPPVSFGGLVVVDEKSYGMTVHHMLDDPVSDGEDDVDGDTMPILRSSAAGQYMPGFTHDDSTGESSEDDYACEFSDSDSDGYSETDMTSDQEDEDDDEDEGEYNEPGDIPGIEPGLGDGFIVTQPAMDDVEEGFYPSDETADEDHLSTFALGEMYASSGIRRRRQDGLVHEIDWALFEFQDQRLPGGNSIPRVPNEAPLSPSSKRRSGGGVDGELRPTTVVPATGLPGLEVQCIARTSGLQTGTIQPTLVSVKIYGRKSSSQSYQVSGAKALTQHSGTESDQPGSRLPMGIPGDSGAWVVDRRHGRLCGHVLAWSERKRVAYICPMEVLLHDIAETLEATEIRLPGGEPLRLNVQGKVGRAKAVGEDDVIDAEDLEDLLEEELDEDDERHAALARSTSSIATGSSAQPPVPSQRSARKAPSKLAKDAMTSSAFNEKAAALDLAGELKDMRLSTQEIGVESR